MAIVTLQTPNLSRDQKKRIGDRIIAALQQENLAPGSVVVLFKPETDDIYLDGLLLEAQGQAASAAPAPSAPAPAPRPAAPLEGLSEDFKTRPRRTKAELERLKQELAYQLQTHGSLSSFETQEKLGLKDCDWAPATLRRFFAELEEQGAIEKVGQKRGTRYVWKGMVNLPSNNPAAVKLIKGRD